MAEPVEIVVRRARNDDREQVFEVESKSTPRLSYVPKVFDMFLSDETGEFLVAEVNECLVACGKFTVVPDGSAWLETLRVIPEYQGLGIGKRFYERFFEIARQKGVPKMRM
ncbi:MAG: GNAT family N-acetyltransferase, partial [Anaerolineaceae bacterium]|nr:GNAT family N-acetyltransferase [Anaerolineaceae bacterium]